MEISKINSLPFGCVHTENKNFTIKPNNLEKHNKRSKIILLGLTALGTAAVAMLLIKKQKLPFLNSTKAENTLSNAVQNQEKSIEKVIESTAEKTSQNMVQTTEKLESQIALESNNSSKITLIDEMHAVDEKASVTAVVEKVEDKKVVEKEMSLSTVGKQTQDPIVEKAQENTVATKAIKRQRRSSKYQKQNVVENIKRNRPYINSVIKNSDKFEMFGVDEELVRALETVDPEIVKLMDDEFLSILLIPKDKVKVDFADYARMPVKENSIKNFLERTILKNTPSAKRNRLHERKMKVFKYVGTFSENSERIERIKSLDSEFTPEEIKKILNSDSITPRRNLLSWLAEFQSIENRELVRRNLK